MAQNNNSDSKDKNIYPESFLASRWANTIRYSLMNLFILLGTYTMAMGGWWM